MTPKVLNIYLKAHNERQMNKIREDIYQAYLISRWVWQKKIDIEKILNQIGSKEPKKVMTDETMFKQVQILNRLFGGEVKTCQTQEYYVK